MRGKVTAGRLAVVCALASLAVAANAGTAWGQATIVATPTNQFVPTSYSHTAGTVATLLNNGGSHNVTATINGPDGKALFRSATITGGTTPVNGTQFIGAGSYVFICTVHPATMQGTLNVSGTPLPRPAVTLKVLSGDIDRVADKRKLRVRATNTGSAGVMDLTAKLGRKTLGSLNDVNVPAGQSQAKLKLTKSGRSALRDRDKATVKLAGAVDFGLPANAKRKLK